MSIACSCGLDFSSCCICQASTIAAAPPFLAGGQVKAQDNIKLGWQVSTQSSSPLASVYVCIRPSYFLLPKK